jgi:NADPH:quinone reductase
VLGLAGGDALERCLAALKKDGRLAYPNGVHPPAQHAGVSVTGYDAVAGPAEFARLNSAITQAKLVVPIAAQYPLADAQEAQRRLEAGHVAGKIVLQIH